MSRFHALLIFAAFLAGSAVAHAGETTAAFQVSVRVVNSCTVATEAMRFPDYNPKGAGVTGHGTIALTCSRGTPASVFLEGERALRDANGEAVRYTLTDASGQPWTAIQSVSTMGQGRIAVRLPVIGHIEGGQIASDGEYAGQLLVRVAY